MQWSYWITSPCNIQHITALPAWQWCSYNSSTETLSVAVNPKIVKFWSRCAMCCCRNGITIWSFTLVPTKPVQPTFSWLSWMGQACTVPRGQSLKTLIILCPFLLHHSGLFPPWWNTLTMALPRNLIQTFILYSLWRLLWGSPEILCNHSFCIWVLAMLWIPRGLLKITLMCILTVYGIIIRSHCCFMVKKNRSLTWQQRVLVNEELSYLFVWHIPWFECCFIHTSGRPE